MEEIHKHKSTLHVVMVRALTTDRQEDLSTIQRRNANAKGKLGKILALRVTQKLPLERKT